jgi:hypothetical protein
VYVHEQTHRRPFPGAGSPRASRPRCRESSPDPGRYQRVVLRSGEPPIAAPACIEGLRRDAGVGKGLLVAGTGRQRGDQIRTYCLPKHFAVMGAALPELRIVGVQALQAAVIDPPARLVP